MNNVVELSVNPVQVENTPLRVEQIRTFLNELLGTGAEYESTDNCIVLKNTDATRWMVERKDLFDELECGFDSYISGKKQVPTVKYINREGRNTCTTTLDLFFRKLFRLPNKEFRLYIGAIE